MFAEINLRATLQMFSAQRLRAVLAMLGVFLGALLLTLIAHILGAVGLLMENEAKALGSHVVTVTATRPAFDRDLDKKTILVSEQGEDESTSQQTFGENAPEPAATLTPEQMQDALETIPFLTAGVPFVNMKGQLAAQRRTTSCQILGTPPEYVLLRRARPLYGRFFNPAEEEKKALVCVLGHALAERLFGSAETAVGGYVRLEYSQLLVIGVMSAKGADSRGTNMDEVIFLPLRTLMQRFSSRDHVSGFYLGMQSREASIHIEQSLSALLRARHRIDEREKDDFSIAFAGRVNEMIANAVSLITTLGFIGAGISFGVGTLGVFSIMLLMVHARKTEIGVRRALGASRRNILHQFLGEAAVMAGGGGFLGVLTALSLSGLISLVGLLPTYVDPLLAIGVCLLSLLCGVLAGGYPAWKASRLPVIAALRG
jgi:putative ABC transport system permease protein